MEILGAFLDEEWDFCSMFSTNGEIPSTDFLSSDRVDESSFLPPDHSFCYISQPNESMNYYNHNLMMPVFSDDVMEEILHLKGQLGNAESGDSCKEIQLRRKYEETEIQIQTQEISENYSLESPEKKPRLSQNVQKNQSAVKSKKNKKTIQDNVNEEESNAGGNIQNLSSYSSEDDSNASRELNGGSISESKSSVSFNSNSKTRASRGSATDPQSLYARRRRERINERLRILQNLVPNGTKVDISTMLEEAVQYVKFLQLQIKLLSSDDLWMYAPIAYNGMDIGIYQKISPNLISDTLI